MCFDTTKHQKPKIATEDIICWKVIKSNGNAYHQNWHYKIGDTQPRVKIRKVNHSEEYTSINEGYDSYINEGYHSYTNIEKAKRYRCWRSYIVGRFIIPKGTRYFHNKEEGEYVAEVIQRIPYKK